MILDTERNLIAVENEYIYLTTRETICLDLIIRNKYRRYKWSRNREEN
jgi:hypothetical protein